MDRKFEGIDISVDDHPTLSREDEKELSERISKGDEAAEDKLVLYNRKLAVAIATEYHKKYYGKLDLNNLISAGFNGLVEASKRYDHKKGAKFSTYAAFWIRQKIREVIRHDRKQIRIPGSSFLKSKKVITYINRNTDELGNQPSIDQVRSEFPDVSERKIKPFLHLKFKESLDSLTKDGIVLSDVIPDENCKSPFENLRDNSSKEEIKYFLGVLNDREYFIITKKFGVCGEEKHTLQEISDLIGLSRERVRQIQKGALTKMNKLTKRSLAHSKR